MATKYVSGRVKELKVGISNYSESKESLSVIGIVSATKYYGDGSDLTGTQTPGIDTTGSSTFNSLNATHLKVTGVSTFSGNIVAATAEFSGNVTIGGTLTVEDKTNVDSIGLITARSGVRILAGGLNVVGVSTFADIIASSAKISDLTSGRVVYAGASGELQDSANLTFDGTELSAGLIDGGSY